MKPWGLSERQEGALAAVADTGCPKLAARQLGIEYKTLHTHLERARKKMGARVTMLAVLMYDRTRRLV